MASEAPVFGSGTTLEVNDGVAAAFVELDDVSNVTPPDMAVGEVERKRLAATFKERVPNPRVDPGEMTFDYEVSYTKYARLNDLKGVSSSWRVTLADGTQFAFTGFLKTHPVKPVEGEVITTATATVRATSLLTLTDNSP